MQDPKNSPASHTPHTSTHIYSGQVVYFGTKHGKELVLQPVLSALGITLTGVSVNTDQFGTFAGDIPRVGTIRETLRKKLKETARTIPDGELFLASEGSFVPHPVFGLMQTDLESLLFWDKKRNFEIYAEFLCKNPVHREILLAPSDDFRSFLEAVNFPHFGVIVRPDSSPHPIYKDFLHSHEVAQAVLDAFVHSPQGRVLLSVDLRAHKNPQRQQAIRQAGEVLLEKLLSSCPDCQLPGYGIQRSLGNLKCSACGFVSRFPSEVEWGCVACPFTEIKARPDGIRQIEPEECEYCNP